MALEAKGSNPFIHLFLSAVHNSEIVIWERNFVASGLLLKQCNSGGTLGVSTGLSPSGKAQHFDCCSRWFESS